MSALARKISSWPDVSGAAATTLAAATSVLGAGSIGAVWAKDGSGPFVLCPSAICPSVLWPSAAASSKVEGSSVAPFSAVALGLTALPAGGAFCATLSAGLVARFFASFVPSLRADQMTTIAKSSTKTADKIRMM